ncbi:MAG: hypothetical protein V3W14_06185, partial [Candidatus Neomarinimicrobiota bacterium]
MNLLLAALLPLMIIQDSSSGDSTNNLIPAGINASRADTLLPAYEQYLAGQELSYEVRLNLARQLAHGSHWQE